MTVQFKAGIFQKISGLGAQSVTGVGFLPKLLGFVATSTNLNTFQSETTVLYGFASSTGTSKQRSFGIGNEDNVNRELARSHWHTATIWSDSQSGSSFNQLAILFTFNSDGFTIFFNSNSGVDWQISYIAIGGNDISNVDVGHFVAPSSTGIASTTVGYKPDLCFLLGTNHTSDNSARSDRASFCFGAFNAAGEQGVTSVITVDNAYLPMKTARYQRTNKCLAMFSTTSTSTITHEASFSSMNSTGFSLNYNKAAGSGKRVLYVAIKGVNSKIGSLNSPTNEDDSVQTISGLGLTPRGLILLSDGNESSTSIRDHLRHSIGAGNTANSRWANWAGERDGVSLSITASRIDNNQIMRISTEQSSASQSTTQALASLASLASGAFTLNWTTFDTGHAYQVIYIAIADAGPPGAQLYERSIAASVSISAPVTGNRFRSRSIVATAEIVGVVNRTNIQLRSISDNIQVDSEVTPTTFMGVYARSIAAAIAIATNLSTQTITTTGLFTVTLAEFVTIVSTVTKIGQTIERTVSEALTIVATVTRKRSMIRTLTQAVELLVPLTIVKIAPRTVSETLTIDASITKFKIFPRTVSNTIKIVSTAAKRRMVNRAVSNVLTLTVNGFALKFARRTINDTVAVADTGLTRLRSVYRTFPVDIIIAAPVSRIRSVARTADDSLTIVSTSLERLRTVSRNPTETVIIDSILTRVSYIFKTVGQSVAVDSSLTRLRIVPRTLVQSLVLLAVPTRTANFFRHIVQQINVSAGGLSGNIVGVPPYVADTLGRFFTMVPQMNVTSVIFFLKRYMRS